MATITRHADGVTFDCAPGDTILRAALRAGLGMPYSCNVGSCGNCRFELLEGEVTHLRDDAPAWSERDLKRNRYLGCQAAPSGDCRIKVRDDPAAVSRHPPQARQGTLVSATPVTRDISEFVFDVGPDAPFRPGQYALISAPGVAGGRAYSMANPSCDGTWRFLIKRVPDGAVTTHLFDTARPGDALTIDGPYGTAWLREDAPRDIVLLAGGSGLSPMVSIARAALDGGMLGDRKLHFFYGGRAQPDLFDAEQVLGSVLAEKVTLISALSEPQPGWTGPTGFLHEVAARHMGDAFKEAEVYFAGPAVMSQAVQLMLHEAGVPKDRVHFDEFY